MPQHEIWYSIPGRNAGAGTAGRKHYLFIFAAIIALLLVVFMLIARAIILGLMRRSGGWRKIFRKNPRRGNTYMADVPDVSPDRFRIITTVHHSHAGGRVMPGTWGK